MSVDLFERYKDALRRGHMAVAHGRLDAALDAYREAVNLAPDRALPHASIGQVLLRQGAATNALAAFDAALLRAPRNEGGLRGRAEALAKLGRRTDAAAVLDLLADLQETAGRLGDANDSARRALDLAEQKGRRRRLQDLTRRVRLATGESPGEQALTSALRPLETAEAAAAILDEEPAAGESAGESPTVADEPLRAPGDESARPAGDAGPEAVSDVQAEPEGGEAEPELAAGTETPPLEDAAAAEPPALDDVAAEPVADSEAEPDAAETAEAEPEPVAAGPDSAPVPEPPPERPDPVALTVDAEQLLDLGDTAGARDRYLAAAAEFEREGLSAAAIDACYVALAFAPDDANLHLRLVELYLQAGWNGFAADKLALLGRLTELDDRQRDARPRIMGLAADYFPDDPRLRHLTAGRRPPA